MESNSTHLLVLFDDAGRITSLGEIDQEAMGRDASGQVYLSAEGRHFVQVQLNDELRSATHNEILTGYVVSHSGGADAKLVREADLAS